MLEVHYDWRLVALSVAIAIAASYTALDLAGRIATAQGRTRVAWLIGGATSMGLGVWAMHYIGMLAYRLPLPVSYSLPVVGLSLLAAMAASAVALYVVSAKELTPAHLASGSLTMGSGIGAMHYVGMHAMRVGAHRSYSTWMVALSIAVAVAVSGVALFLAFQLREEDEDTVWSRPLGAAVMGVAVAGMHYLGMAAVCFHDVMPMASGRLISVSSLGVFSIATIVFTILALSVTGSVAKSRFLHQERLLTLEQENRFRLEAEIAARKEAEAQVRMANERMGELVAERTAELQESQAKWKGLVAGLPQLIWVIDREGQANFVSEACMRYSGLTEQELLGWAFLDHVHPDDRQPLVSTMEAAFASYSGYQLEIRLRSKEGAYRWFQVRSNPVFEVGDQRPTQWLGSSTDIDDQKRSKELLEEAVAQRTLDLEEALQRAECAMRAKSEFLAVMSHEIRTPMNGVIGMAHLMLDTPLTETQRGYLDAIRSSGQALLTIINDILDFSKIEAGKLEIYEEEFDLRTMAHECIDLVRPGAAQKQLALSLQIGDDVPRRVVGDCGRLRQILLNLLSNAIKFTPAGTVSLEVVRHAEKPHELRFRVQDSGIGLSPRQIGNLFQAFTQADKSTTRRFGGTGLGLSIARRLVELMGGDIHVESEEGVGSTFWFQLPLKLGQSGATDDTTEVIPARELLKGLFAGSGLRVLIADDVATNQIVARGLLREFGLHGDAVSDGAEAIAVLDTLHYDLVLMDVHMPEMDGLEATRRIRGRAWDAERHPRLPIIALTASAMPGDRQKFLEAGMDDFISKPIMPTELVAVLRKWLPAAPAERPASVPPVPAEVPKEDQESCVFDRAGLLGRVMGDVQLAKAVSEGFRYDMPGHVARLLEMAGGGDFGEVADLAHRIRGASATVGGEQVRAITEAIETAGRAADRPRILAEAACLASAFPRLMDALSAGPEELKAAA